jgi:hypothetical protein
MTKLKSFKWVAALAMALAGLLLIGRLARAGFNIVPLASTNAYLPIVIVNHTPTPTRTPTPTATPSATATTVPPTPTTLTGSLTLCNPSKTTYTKTELVCVEERITNNNNFTLYYGVLGVNVIGPRTWFQTSWSNGSIGPNCTGPKNACDGPWQDNVRGYDNTAGFKNPGTYVLYLGICYSSLTSCQSGQGVWQNFVPGVTITITN